MKIEDSHNLKFTSEQQKAVVNIRITSNFIGGKQHQLMSQFGLSMAQFNVLGILRGAKTPLSVHVVKERMIEKSPNTTRLMDKLIEFFGTLSRIRAHSSQISLVALSKSSGNV